MQNQFNHNYLNYSSEFVSNNFNKSNNLSHNYIMKQDLYNSIIDYYGDVLFTKLNSKSTSDGNTYGLYYCQIGCMLCIDNRYLLAIVKESISQELRPNDNTNNDEIPIGTQMYLSNLHWISFQTRTIEDFKSINQYNIRIKQQNVKNNRNAIVDMEMKLSEELSDRVRYECSEHYPITVDIMKKKSREKNIYNMMDGYEKEYFTPICSLQTLLESYQSVVTLNI